MTIVLTVVLIALVVVLLVVLGLALSAHIVKQYEQGVLFGFGRVLGLRPAEGRRPTEDAAQERSWEEQVL